MKRSAKQAARAAAGGQSMVDLGAAWYESRVGKLAKNTLDGDRASLAHINEFFRKNTDINSITALDMSEFVEWLNAKNIPARATRVMQIAEAVWDYAVRKGIVISDRRNPVETAKGLLTPYQSKPEGHLAESELALFFIRS
ncbi:phage integrase SAM-like domain-containing protein [Neisseria subflava]|uniref:Phage integrase SAM-like domain-containing protein n=1 Tax=Neisseria subflava TaxID=28449 RepID=A0A9X9N714_NEISU|nr:phage integrase SAM-like domain-containing protein [Neisseria subflava]